MADVNMKAYLKALAKRASAFQFQAVLNLCGIKQKKVGNGSNILCPWHNDTDPSAHVYGNHAHCFACGSNTDILNITQKTFGLNGMLEAALYLQEEGILDDEVIGEIMQERSGVKKAPPFLLKPEEMEFIGLEPGGFYEYTTNLAWWSEKAPAGLEIRKEKVNSEGLCPVVKTETCPTVKKLYEENPSAALDMMLGKARETEIFYEERNKQTLSTDTEIGMQLFRMNDPEYVLKVRRDLLGKAREAKRIKFKILDAMKKEREKSRR